MCQKPESAEPPAIGRNGDAINKRGTSVSAPVFVFSAGWRSGSTLLQRLLTASGEVLVWGESGGALNGLADALEQYRQMLGPGGQRYRFGFGGNGAAQFEAFAADPGDGAHRWIASMNPPEARILDSFRLQLETLYAGPARELGFPRWGVKEVLCGLDTARFLRELWPDARFLFLVRHPLDCLLSIKRRNWMDQPQRPDRLAYFAEHWRRLAAEFRAADFGLLLHYERLLNDPQQMRAMCDYLDIGGIPQDFARSSRADWQAQNAQQLGFLERRRALRILGDEMRQHGYAPK
ncbi:sulfotransferase [Thiohalobacter sp. IOR34]|uniref:sulfotransferase family protein n=1 Tax=Thiohalobacter sp. IOR34 TaxID=3057176 RepID=UPI0025B0519D|nr:sulfotransferase [Thiohalobacter sp. IOR34]WJW74441.1 sulfotransferase [Thiohalobacter sp. IOR34]